MKALQRDDPQIEDLIQKEARRIEETLDLIAAENHAPISIMEALGSVFNTKTIEGYPGRRYHAGCRYADEVERLAIDRAKALFKAEHANVQPHSGTSANLAVYFSVLNPGDRILSMALSHGGHLSHGHYASIAGKCFEVEHYGVDRDSGLIDYHAVDRIARRFRPRLIIAGASAYPRCIDYERLAEVARSVAAYFMVDMAHIGGLVAAAVIPSPVPYADFVTFTCYKTMMGGRGGVVLCKERFGKSLDRALFPGCQGTSAVNAIAAKAVIFKLATEKLFIKTQKTTVQNASILAGQLRERGYPLVAGGTDTHQILADVTAVGIDGETAEKALEKAGIILNKNVIPKDQSGTGSISGIRIGTGAVAARGMGADEMPIIGDLLDEVLRRYNDPETLSQVKDKVAALCEKFPVYEKKKEVLHGADL